MKWIVKIDGKPDLRIVVKFSPVDEKIYFIGEYHKAQTNQWTEFSVKYTLKLEIDLETIKLLLYNTYEELDKRVKIYEDLKEGFKYITEIGIKDELVS